MSKQNIWETIEPSTWKPKEEGDHIIGVLAGTEPKDDNAGLSARYYLQNNDGTHLVWGSAVLDARMRFIGINDKIRITYRGKDKNKKNQEMNLYQVDVAKNSNQPETNTPIPEEKIE